MLLLLTNTILSILDVFKPSIPFIVLGIHVIQIVFELFENIKEENFDVSVVSSIFIDSNFKNNLENFKLFFYITSIEDNKLFDFEILARRIGCGLATAGLGGVGTGIGMVFRGLIEGLSRNSTVKDDMFNFAIFGFALTEAIGLFSLMIAFMLLYA